MADALLSIVLDRLASLIQQQFHHEVCLVVGVKREIQSLTNTLQIVRAVVADAEKRQVNEEPVKVWLERLKDIAYQMDDVLDEWSTAFLKSQIERVESPSMPKKKVSSCIPSPCICFKRVARRRDIALKIKGIKQEVEDIANERNQFDFKSTNNEELQRIITISAVDTTEVYGRDRDEGIILRQLLGTSCEQSLGLYTISVFGMGGIGKTTLAQLAFNHDDVKAHFEIRIWVCVSDPFVPIRILRAILEALQGQSSDLHDPEALQQKIQKSICGKKFLLVLDDVWTEDYQLWEQLKNCLKCGGGGSRILVTTRNESVARMMRSTYMHSLGSLPLEQSQALFSQIAFCGKSTDKIEELEEIGKKIADKCKGLPLAVKALGSLMQSKNNKEDWENVLNSKMWELDVFEKKLSPALLLSYYDLPPPIKQCFSYCAVFPKDHSIERDDLIKLWMAQSYLNSKAGREMETVGREYFENLAARSFFQDFEKDDKGNIVRCKMHDIVHDFAQFLTHNECLNLEDDSENLKTNLYLQKGRHASLMVHGSTKFPFSDNNVRNLRTLLVVFDDRYRIDPFPPYSFQQFKYLRAMDLRGNDSIVELPREVGEFVHLRYLNLSYCRRLETLPETISELWNLQTLNVCCSLRLKKLPQGMGNLVNLRHLLISGGIYGVRSLPKGVGRLTSLRTLPAFIVCDEDASDEVASDVCEIEEMRKLNELRGELEIKGLSSVEDAGEAEKAELKNKKHLHGLTLSFKPWKKQTMMMMKEVAEALQPHPNLKSLCIASYQVREWPKWMIEPSLLQLTHLHLSSCIECQCLPPLGELPLLESLKIYCIPEVKYVGGEFLGSSSAIAFPRLKHLSFKIMSKWENWEVKEEGRKVMPCLLSLEITRSPKLAAVPSLLLQRKPPIKLLLRGRWAL
ncbi:putative disease resistance protein RGA3 [Vitis riparia]|uniref:putative disease resistance protein RGA3 n=1 Tax=Vitis riparia TaxID=96939 RepID=UPI00155AB0E4|nr:putative disease resistance protein RGA3 [Vitis riparia]